MKREAKKAVAIAKSNAYERLYQRLDSKEGEKSLSLQGLGKGERAIWVSVSYIKHENSMVLTKDIEV